LDHHVTTEGSTGHSEQSSMVFHLDVLGH